MAKETLKLTLSQAFAAAVIEEMRRDETVAMWGVGVRQEGGDWRDMPGIGQEFPPERVQNMPMTETAIAEMAVGAAFNGIRPVINIGTMGFILTAFYGVWMIMGNHRQEFGWKGPLPIVVYARGGIGGGTGPCHGLASEALFMHSPGIKIVMPSTVYDAKGLMTAAIRDDGPVIVVGPGVQYRGTPVEIPAEEYIIPIGKANICREGNDVTVLAYMGTVARALTAAEEVSKEGISVEVIDLRTLVPLDIEAIEKSVRKTGRVLIAHESMERAGASAEIACRVSDALGSDFFKVMKAPIRRMGAKNVSIIRGEENELALQPQAPNIAKTIKEMV